MKYAIVKNCMIDWETERHSFTFQTGGDRLTALDSLGDLMKSLDGLYKHLLNNYDHGDDVPESIKVRGGCCHTDIL
jgi:hypothetical protein